VRDDGARLADMLEAIERIERRRPANLADLEADELIQTWVLYHLTILGEAASKLSSTVVEEAPDVPWAQIIGLRNVLVHQYFGIDTDLVWNVLSNDLKPLERRLKQLLDSRNQP